MFDDGDAGLEQSGVCGSVSSRGVVDVDRVDLDQGDAVFDEQVDCLGAQVCVVAAHRKPGGRKFTFLRHEIFDWLIANRYEPDDSAP
ncbi:MAG TPA: hypothetical protein VMO52_07060 [Acidimicrobiia bacterium]|nr:hypothetical protein [Acidimicrobiia bacterium]